MKSKREQILKLCETDMEYFEAKPHKALDRLKELQIIILALIDENEKLRAALEKIADYSTAGENEKYVNYERGWHGVADFAKQALTTPSPLDEILEGEE